MFAFRATISEPQLLSTCVTGPFTLTLVTLLLMCCRLSGMQQMQLPARARLTGGVRGVFTPPAAGLNRGQLGPPQEMGPGTTERESDR